MNYKYFILLLSYLINKSFTYNHIFDTKISNKNNVIKKLESMKTFKERFKLLKATDIKYFYTNKNNKILKFPLKINYAMKPPIPNIPSYLIPKIYFNEVWSKKNYESYKCIIRSNYVKINLFIEIKCKNQNLIYNTFINKNTVLIQIECNILKKYKYLPISNNLLEKIITQNMIKIFEIIYY